MKWLSIIVIVAVWCATAHGQQYGRTYWDGYYTWQRHPAPWGSQWVGTFHGYERPATYRHVPPTIIDPQRLPTLCPVYDSYGRHIGWRLCD